MKVTVRLFAQLRERAGRGTVELDLPDGASAGDALRALGDLADGLPLVLAVNREYADEATTLSPGDELAAIPPVSGGAEPIARVVDGELPFAELREAVRDPRAGAVVTFEGVTRSVERLHYEAYAEMAEPRMRQILAEVVAEHGCCAAAAAHRIGAVPLSEPSVVVVVSGPHRGETFDGARAAIDRIKAEAPIWKQEIEAGDASWVEGTPPTPPPPT